VDVTAGLDTQLITQQAAVWAPGTLSVAAAAVLARGNSSLTLTFVYLQEPSSQPKQPVEFDQAINYVNKIKVTAAGNSVEDFQEVVSAAGTGWCCFLAMLQQY
jgi:hypothetical protein